MDEVLSRTSAASQPPGLRRRGARDVMEKVMHGIFFLCGALAVAFVLLISIYLILSGLPAIKEIGLKEFLFGKEWAPTNKTDPKFGILPLLIQIDPGTENAVAIGKSVGSLIS